MQPLDPPLPRRVRPTSRLRGHAAGGVVSRFVGVHDARPTEVVDWLAWSG